MAAAPHVLSSLVLGGVLLSAGCGGAAPPPHPSTPESTRASDATAQGQTLPFGTTDPEVLGPRHYPVWAYEPELFAASGELRARAEMVELDRLKDVPIPSPARRGIGAGAATHELPDRLLIGGEPAD